MFFQKLLLGLLSVGSVALPATPQMALNEAIDVPQTYYSYSSGLRFDCDVNGWLMSQVNNMDNIDPLGSPSWAPIVSDEYSYCFYSASYKIDHPSFIERCWVYDYGDSPYDVHDIFDYGTLTYFAYFDVSSDGDDRFQWYFVPYFHFKSSFLGVIENGFKTSALYWSSWMDNLDAPEAEDLYRYYSSSSIFSGSISDLVDSLSASKFNRDRLPSLYFGSDPSYGSLPSNASDVFFSPLCKPWKLSKNGRQIFDSQYGAARNAAANGFSWFFDGDNYNRFNLFINPDNGVPSYYPMVSMYPANYQDGEYVGDTAITAVGPYFEFYTYSFPLSQTMEVIDIWAMFSAVLTMPFTFVYQAFNITLFQGTMYEFAVGPFVYSVFGILIIVGIFGLIFSFLRGK